MSEQATLASATRSGPASVSVVAAAGLILLTVIPLVLHAAAILSVLFPLAAAAAAIALFRSSLPAYLALVWWLWILTPEIRRLVEYQTGWNPNDPLTLAPYLATAVAVVTILRRVRWLRWPPLSPFVLVMAGLMLGFLVGVVNSGILPATYDWLNWALPPILATHVALTWRHHESYRRVIFRLAAATSVVIGGYAIIQFYLLPAWDRYWMVNVPLQNLGPPEPEKFHAFSTLNSPGPFAEVTVVLILLCLYRRTLLTPLAVVLGTIGLALSQVRSAWLALIVGVLYLLFARRSGAAHVRIIVAASAVVVTVMAVAGPIDTVVGNRLQTFGNLSQDQSFNARVSLYQQVGAGTVLDPVGNGLGSTGTSTKLDSSSTTVFGIDSGFVDIIYSLGWLGTVLYAGGTIAMARRSLRGPPNRAVAQTTTAILVVGIVELIFANDLIGVSGVFLWLPLGLVVAYKIAALSPDRPTAVGSPVGAAAGNP